MKAKLYLYFLLASGLSYGQEWKQIGSVDLKESVSAISVDPDGMAYLGTTEGNLQRLTPSGQQDEYFSAIANSPLTLIEAWNKFKLFLFFRDLQKITFLNRFATTPVVYDLETFDMGYAWLVTPGVDNSIWVLSSNFNELRKYNIQTKQLILTVPLTVDLHQAVHMRAYQNLLIISDKGRGLYLFDQFGNLLQTIDAVGVGYFQIQNGKIIYMQGGSIHLLDPFHSTRIEKVSIPEGASFEQLLVVGQSYFFVGKNKIMIYRREL